MIMQQQYISWTRGMVQLQFPNICNGDQYAILGTKNVAQAENICMSHVVPKRQKESLSL